MGWGGVEDLLLCSWDEDDFTSSTVSTTDQQPGVSHAHDDPSSFHCRYSFYFHARPSVRLFPMVSFAGCWTWRFVLS